ncbi:BQ2448_5387 [Microbotryum intermedium]|uniref:BQ2448_5387 protein n=1 Tax=Microbotryum intermedium TaxID=269621 RepID=A0A238F9M2_9BASI|nr:BQ2448_5387 [Microbotryum intermedium]
MSVPPIQARYGRLGGVVEDETYERSPIAGEGVSEIMNPAPTTTTPRRDVVVASSSTEQDEARHPILARTRTRQRSRDNGRGQCPPRTTVQDATPPRPNSAYTLDRTLLQLPLDWSKPTPKDRIDRILKLVLGTFFVVSIVILIAIVFTELGHDIWPDRRPSSSRLHPVLGTVQNTDGAQDSVVEAVVTTDVEGDIVVVPVEQGGEIRYGRSIGARSWKS